MNKKVKRALAMALVALMLVQMSFAIPWKSQGKGFEKFYEKHFEKHYEKIMTHYNVIDGQLIRVKNKNIDFDTPPVIKEGRTLIPVRAISEALGAQVMWDGDNQVVTIISPDGLMQHKFYLKTGDVTLAERLATDLPFGTESLVEIDVPPGLINNRTFVPLRFIAKTFGLKVDYDDDTGEIDIDEKPKLTPQKRTFTDAQSISDIDVLIKLNGYAFKDITGWVPEDDGTPDNDFDYVLVDDDANDDMVLIKLKARKIETLTAYKTPVVFNFTMGDEVESESFEIKLAWMDPDLSKPDIIPDEIKYLSEDQVPDLVPISLKLEDYDFMGITGWTMGQGLEDAYTITDTDVTDDMVTINIKKAAILALNAYKSNVIFNFTKTGQDPYTQVLQVELEWLDPQVLKPEITPDKVTFDSPLTTTPVAITLNPKAYTFDGIVGLSAKEDENDTDFDYSLEGNLVTLTKSYIDGLSQEKTELALRFVQDNSADVILDFDIELSYLKESE